MALPTVPAAVMDAVAPEEMGKASGINVMAQPFGAVFAIAIGSAVFSANGHLGTPAGVTAGFQPVLWACVAFAALATLSCFTPHRTRSRRSSQPGSPRRRRRRLILPTHHQLDR